MTSCAATVVLISKDGTDEFTCAGTYYADGQLVCSVGEHTLSFTPNAFHPEDPKRLLLDSGKWSRFCVKSIILDVKR